MSEVFTLENGVRIVLEPVSSVRSISCGIWVRSGSRNESPELNGISHFIEHMMFKGTKNRTARQIADSMDSIGGEINAYTSKEYTCYHTVTLDINFSKALEILSDMFFNSKFSDSDIKKERSVILEEISMYEDSPEEIIYDNLQEQIWKNHSLGYPILGTAETLEGFDSKKIKKHYAEQYTPENTVVSVAGHFENDMMIEEIKKYFGMWQSGTNRSNSAVQKEKLIPPEFRSTVFARQKDIEQVHICFGFPGLQTGAEDVYALAIFNALFGGGMSSRLFQKIREEKGLVYSVYSFISNYKDTGLFSVYAGMNSSQTEEVLHIIQKEIRNIKKSKITDEKISRIKEQFKSNIIISDESTASRMSSIGRSILLLDRVQTLDEKIKKVDAVTLEDIYDVCDKIFKQGKMSFAAIGKVDNLDFNKMLEV